MRHSASSDWPVLRRWARRRVSGRGRTRSSRLAGNLRWWRIEETRSESSFHFRSGPLLPSEAWKTLFGPGHWDPRSECPEIEKGRGEKEMVEVAGWRSKRLREKRRSKMTKRRNYYGNWFLPRSAVPPKPTFLLFGSYHWLVKFSHLTGQSSLNGESSEYLM